MLNRSTLKCNMQHATRNTQHATRNTQHATRNTPRFRSLARLILTTAMVLLAGLSFADDKSFEDRISIEGWETNAVLDVPILRFDSIPEASPFYTDIKPVNVMQDDNGSIRFQLSKNTAFGQHVFANVIATDLGNGMLRNTITNIADGKQTTFVMPIDQADIVPPGRYIPREQTLQAKSKGGETSPEVIVLIPPAVWVGGALYSAAMCMINSELAFSRCQRGCRRSGGIQAFSDGTCGLGFTCICMPPPPPRTTPPGP
ncbi:MAG: hypothetical protein L3J24_12615 [Xanthomonadales bacterium]|nr:hypothetical protein [Xanthomonadales bacterium]